MSDRISGLFFPLSSLSISEVLKAGESILEFKVKKSGGKYSGKFFKSGKEIKLTTEKISEHDFCASFVDFYHFRSPDKQYNSAKKFLARIGFGNKGALEMEYSDQKYKFKYQAQLESGSREVQLFYSPVVGRMVVRGL